MAMAYEHTTARYRNWYANLLRLYPKPYHERFGEGMEQTFNDLCRERRETGDGLFAFVLWVFVETFIGIIKEHLSYNNMKNIATAPKSAAIVGFLFVLPFLILNTIVGAQIEPFYSLMRPEGYHTGPSEYVLLFTLLLVLPLIGAFIAVRPMFRKGEDGKRKFYVLNIVIAAILLIGSITLPIGLGTEIYRCNVLQIPNCD